ncbi:S24/S26 family peptidase [Methanobacterium oryzae]|uniref:S24/S26 family peptidase n=1 Tax=Methanobacterium oryzae TaxID=69540 RepID=UPI003D1C74D7
MSSKTGIILVTIILIAVIIMAVNQPQQSYDVVQSQNDSQNSEQINKINVIINTDGSITTVKAISVSGVKVPDKMLKEMKNKASKDIKSEKSNVNSINGDIKAIATKYNYTAEVTITSQFGTDQLPFPATVSGNSMVPTLKDGQDVIALKTSNFKVGDIVIARHSTYGLIIKRVAAIKNGKVFLKSDNREVEIITTEKTLPDGVVEIETYKKTPVDTWQPKKNVIGVVKTY